MANIFGKIRKSFNNWTGSDVRRRIAAVRDLGPGDRERMAFYQQFMGSGDLVFDVGANLGNRTRLFLGLGARVVAFEPQQNCADLLAQAFQPQPRFTLLRTALGAADGEAVMFISAEHAVSTLSADWVRDTTDTGRFQGVTWDDRATVPVTTLDKVIAQHGVPTFIKIDVEGFEYEVLKGLSKPINAASIEFATESLQNTFLAMEHMAGLGDSAFQIALGEVLDFVETQWMTLDQAKQKLSDLCAQDPMAWGDVYIKRK